MVLTDKSTRGWTTMNPFDLMGRESYLEIEKPLRYLHSLYMSGNDDFFLHHFVMFLR